MIPFKKLNDKLDPFKSCPRKPFVTFFKQLTSHVLVLIAIFLLFLIASSFGVFFTAV